MPPTKKRPSKRYTFESERFQLSALKARSVEGRVRRLIVEQRQKNREELRREVLGYQRVKMLQDRKRRTFVPPRSEEERRVRLQSVRAQLLCKLKIKQMLLYSVGEIEMREKQAELEKTEKKVEEVKEEERRAFEEFADEQKKHLLRLQKKMMEERARVRRMREIRQEEMRRLKKKREQKSLREAARSFGKLTTTLNGNSVGTAAAAAATTTISRTRSMSNSTTGGGGRGISTTTSSFTSTALTGNGSSSSSTNSSSSASEIGRLQKVGGRREREERMTTRQLRSEDEGNVCVRSVRSSSSFNSNSGGGDDDSSYLEIKHSSPQSSIIQAHEYKPSFYSMLSVVSGGGGGTSPSFPPFGASRELVSSASSSSSSHLLPPSLLSSSSSPSSSRSLLAWLGSLRNAEEEGTAAAAAAAAATRGEGEDAEKERETTSSSSNWIGEGFQSNKVREVGYVEGGGGGGISSSSYPMTTDTAVSYNLSAPVSSSILPSTAITAAATSTLTYSHNPASMPPPDPITPPSLRSATTPIPTSMTNTTLQRRVAAAVSGGSFWVEEGLEGMGKGGGGVTEIRKKGKREAGEHPISYQNRWEETTQTLGNLPMPHHHHLRRRGRKPKSRRGSNGRGGGEGGGMGRRGVILSSQDEVEDQNMIRRSNHNSSSSSHVVNSSSNIGSGLSSTRGGRGGVRKGRGKKVGTNVVIDGNGAAMVRPHFHLRVAGGYSRGMSVSRRGGGRKMDMTGEEVEDERSSSSSSFEKGGGREYEKQQQQQAVMDMEMDSYRGGGDMICSSPSVDSEYKRAAMLMMMESSPIDFNCGGDDICPSNGHSLNFSAVSDPIPSSSSVSFSSSSSISSFSNSVAAAVAPHRSASSASEASLLLSQPQQPSTPPQMMNSPDCCRGASTTTNFLGNYANVEEALRSLSSAFSSSSSSSTNTSSPSVSFSSSSAAFAASLLSVWGNHLLPLTSSTTAALLPSESMRMMTTTSTTNTNIISENVVSSLPSSITSAMMGSARESPDSSPNNDNCMGSLLSSPQQTAEGPLPYKPPPISLTGLSHWSRRPPPPPPPSPATPFFSHPVPPQLPVCYSSSSSIISSLTSSSSPSFSMNSQTNVLPSVVAAALMPSCLRPSDHLILPPLEAMPNEAFEDMSAYGLSNINNGNAGSSSILATRTNSDGCLSGGSSSHSNINVSNPHRDTLISKGGLSSIPSMHGNFCSVVFPSVSVGNIFTSSSVNGSNSSSSNREGETAERERRRAVQQQHQQGIDLGSGHRIGLGSSHHPNISMSSSPFPSSVASPTFSSSPTTAAAALSLEGGNVILYSSPSYAYASTPHDDQDEEDQEEVDLEVGGGDG